jgi:ABC-type sugar transport system ATPase subunit
MATPAARARGISKQFGATRALDGVDFDVMSGEIHALVGENGAGKSTLVRILGGVHRPDTGVIAVEGRPAVSTVRRTPSPPASPSFHRSCGSSLPCRSRKT